MNDDKMFEGDEDERVFHSSQGFRAPRGLRSPKLRKGLSDEHRVNLERARASRTKFFDWTRDFVRKGRTPWIWRVAKTSDRISREDRLHFLLVFADPPKVRRSEVDNSDEDDRTVYVQVVSERRSTYQMVIRHFQPPTHPPAYRVVCNEKTNPDELIASLSSVYGKWRSLVFR